MMYLANLVITSAMGPYWRCAMTARDVNKKPQALNILFCRRKLQKSMFIRKGGFTGEEGLGTVHYLLGVQDRCFGVRDKDFF